jgi:hypothetical protein
MSKLTRAAQRCTDAEGKLAERLIERFDEAMLTSSSAKIGILP